MAGWVLLVAGILLRSPVLRDRVAGFWIPLALTTLYAAIILVHWTSVAEGGFGSLSAVAALFSSEWILLAGWVHLLAFDLLIGGWIARDAATRAVPRWALLPVLPAACLLGPAGFLLWIMIRTSAPSATRRRPGPTSMPVAAR
ncbi:ABA4-like family protein [Sediminicoccus sp. KRV36]|uniref:ABA4-like family protein n=1 Tax=Sediminicoccus sp. KRV36 TaxID=3133721 RepID=UPI00200F9D22|nr:ABA4-like family protein [Sediminicoccus rosea]